MYTRDSLDETILAAATASGHAAIAIIRLSGPRAFQILQTCFQGRSAHKMKSHRVYLGYILDEQNDFIDQVLVTAFRKPHSYTGDDTIEISSHGSPAITEAILQRLIRSGARAAGRGEFSFRAFMNGKLDISQAESVADLIAAESRAEARLALTALKGGIRTEIGSIRDQLIHFASMLELELDFGEEEVEFADRAELLALLTQTSDRIETLIQTFQLGNAIKRGINTVIAGRPNAGKSTLLNRLLQEERAIVSDIPGTTRDSIEEILHIEGIPFRLIDTAGIREAQDQIEAIGIQRTKDKIKQSSILLYVADVIELSPAQVQADIELLRHPDLEIILVLNKMDRNPYTRPEDFLMEGLTSGDIIPISAKNNMNIIYLRERIGRTTQEALHQLQHRQASPILTNARHIDSLTNVSEHLHRAHQQIEAQRSSDLVAMDIRQAMHHLGEITGEISTEDLLESIFTKFCIGK
jgi:tRNA modification GTPase